MLNNSRQSLTLHRVTGTHAHQIRKVDRCEGEGWISCHRSKLWNVETREVWLSILHTRRRHGTDYGHDTLVDKVLSCKTEINQWIKCVNELMARFKMVRLSLTMQNLHRKRIEFNSTILSTMLLSLRHVKWDLSEYLTKSGKFS